jgi:hypothetical protein
VAQAKSVIHDVDFDNDMTLIDISTAIDYEVLEYPELCVK